LIRIYRSDTSAYGHLKPATKADYEKGLKPLENDRGKLLIEGLRRKHVSAIRNRYAEREVPVNGSKTGETVKVSKAWQAVVFSLLSILLGCASDTLEWREDNPALRPKRLRTDSDGFRPWKQNEFMQFWERSDAEWRFAALFALLSGQRGQDQVAMKRNDCDGARLHVEQQKGRSACRFGLRAIGCFEPPSTRAVLHLQSAHRYR
jgi:hypothetical protein